MIIQCKSCGLTLGESFSHFTPIEVTCVVCLTERWQFQTWILGLVTEMVDQFCMLEWRKRLENYYVTYDKIRDLKKVEENEPC